MSQAAEIHKEMASHNCGNKSIVRNNHPLVLKVGWKCLGCGKIWLINISGLKNPDGERLLRYAGDPFATGFTGG